jgi:hypothetical protein
MASPPRALRSGGIGGETVDDLRFAIANQPGDERAQAMVRADYERERLRSRAREILESVTKDTYSDDQVSEVVQDLIAVRLAARDGIRAVIQAGRHLRQLQDRVGMAGYKGLLRAGLATMPESIASYCRTIAQAVDDGRITQERLPAAVRPAYELARLEPQVLTLVAERVQLGPDTTAREIRQAAAAVRAEAIPHQPADPSRLEERVRELERRRDAELERVRQRYAREIEAARARLEAMTPKRRGRSRQAA